MKKTGYDPTAVDALIDRNAELSAEVATLRTLNRNAEQLLAAIIREYSGGDDELPISQRSALGLPKDFTLTWHEAPSGCGHILKMNS